jgi:integrase
MSGRQAKLMTEPIIRRALAHAERCFDPSRARTMLLLSLRAGLRAGEIAKLDWEMVLDPKGAISWSMAVTDDIAKKGSGRRIPLHPELRAALKGLAKQGHKTGPIIRSRNGTPLRPNSVVNWFLAFYAAIGAAGCSSHSGRQTFITHAARNAHRAGASLRDVQLLAGHRSIEVTQGYIDGDTDAQRRLVASL